MIQKKYLFKRKVKFLSLLFLCVFYFSHSCYAAPPIESLDILFKRVLTQGGTALHPILRHHINAFFLRNWINTWRTVGSDPQVFEECNDSCHQRLHRVLYERLKTAQKAYSQDSSSFQNKLAHRAFERVKVGLFQYPQATHLESKNSQGWLHDVRLSLYRKMESRRGDFLDGHFIHVSGRTKFPMVFANLRQREPSVEDQVVIRYLLPIENALVCHNVADYRMEAGLMNGWTLGEGRAPYAGLSIVGIDEGTDVDWKMGLNSPQEFPKHTKHPLLPHRVPEFSDLNLLSSIQSIIDSQGHANIVEQFLGGRFQILAGAVQRYITLDLGFLDGNSNDSDRNDRKTGVRQYTYLIDNKLDNTEINIPQRLYESRVLTDTDWDSLKDWWGDFREALKPAPRKPLISKALEKGELL